MVFGEMDVRHFCMTYVHERRYAKRAATIRHSCRSATRSAAPHPSLLQFVDRGADDLLVVQFGLVNLELVVEPEPHLARIERTAHAYIGASHGASMTERIGFAESFVV